MTERMALSHVHGKLTWFYTVMNIPWTVSDDKDFCNVCTKRIADFEMMLPALHLFSHRFDCQLMDLK
jgi:hypothetical protein